MRIAIISDLVNFEWAGCEELWAALALSALQAGHAVALFQSRPVVSAGKLSPLLAAGLEVVPYGFGPLLAEFLQRRVSWKLGLLMRRLLPSFGNLEAFEPDLVFLNAGDPLPSDEFLRGVERSVCLRYRYVIACHNSYLFGPPPDRRLRDQASLYYRRAEYVFFVASRTRRETEHLLATKLERTMIVRNPVNMTDTTEVPMPGGDTFRLASVGRLATHSKGQDVLMAVLGSDALRSRDWILSIYGEGPHLEYLKFLAEHYDIADKVRFLGQVSDVRAVWGENHLLLLPSRNESAPLVVVEAMLCGRPSVVADVGGVREWISEPETGFVSLGSSLESFQAALERAFAARQDWEEIGRRARERAQAMMDPDPGGTLLKRLEEIVSQAGARGECP